MLSQIVHTNPDANASTVPIPNPPRKKRKRRHVFSRPPQKGVKVKTAPSKDDDASHAVPKKRRTGVTAPCEGDDASDAVVSNAPLQTTVGGHNYDHEDGSSASANVLGDPAYYDGMHQLVHDDHDCPNYWK